MTAEEIDSSVTQRYTAPETPAEVAVQLAAAKWHDAQRRADEARAELAALIEEHVHTRLGGAWRGTVGVTRAAQLTGLSRTTVQRMVSPGYQRRQSLR